jgi:hypothetical protein
MEGQVTNGDQGSENLGWRAGLPDEFKHDDWAKTHSNVGDFFREAKTVKTEHDDLKTKMDNALFVPGDEATDEDRDAFFNKLGRPNKPDDYQFEDVEWPEGFSDDYKEVIQNDVDVYRPLFHKLGLTDNQAKELQKFATQRTLEQWQKNQELKAEISEKAIEDLKKEWGSDFDVNSKGASRAFDKIGELAGIKKEFSEFMRDSGLGNNPMLVKAFHEVWKIIGDDSTLDTDGSSNFNKKTDVQRGADGRPILNFPSMQK